MHNQAPKDRLDSPKRVVQSIFCEIQAVYVIPEAGFFLRTFEVII